MIQCGIDENTIKEAISSCILFNNYYILMVVKDREEFEYYKNKIQNQLSNQKNLVYNARIFKYWLDIQFLNDSYIFLYEVDCICGLRAHRVYYSNNINDRQIIDEVIKPQANLEYKEKNNKEIN